MTRNVFKKTVLKRVEEGLLQNDAISEGEAIVF